MQDLLDRLHEIDVRRGDLEAERAATMREIVAAAGGVMQAAALLRLDPQTVRQQEGADGVVMVIYRRSDGRRTDADGRVYGETGEGERSDAQLQADRKWFVIAPARRGELRAVVYVVDGEVARVREVIEGEWEESGGKVALPLGPPLSAAELAEKFPTLPLPKGSSRPSQRGKIREYIPL